MTAKEDFKPKDKYRWPLALAFVYEILKNHPEGLQKQDFLKFTTAHLDPKEKDNWPIGNRYKCEVGANLNREFLKTLLFALIRMDLVKQVGEGNATKYILKDFKRQLNKSDYKKKLSHSMQIFNDIEKDFIYNIEFSGGRSVRETYEKMIEYATLRDYYWPYNLINDDGGSNLLELFNKELEGKYKIHLIRNKNNFAEYLFQHLETTYSNNELIPIGQRYLKLIDKLSTYAKEWFDIVDDSKAQMNSFNLIFSILPGLMHLAHTIREDINPFYFRGSNIDARKQIKDFIKKKFIGTEKSPHSVDFINYPIVSFAMVKKTEWHNFFPTIRVSKQDQLFLTYSFIYCTIVGHLKDLLQFRNDIEAYIEKLDDFYLTYKKFKHMVNGGEPLPGFCDNCRNSIKIIDS